jgi:serine phosphatase RsbU (regulator of sigma subunit)/DNA-binding LacI/PurR family transcriptional regulator
VEERFHPAAPGVYNAFVPKPALLQASRRTVGFLTTESSLPYNASLIAALAATCEDRDVNLVVFTNAYLRRDGAGAQRLFAAKLAGPDNVDAMIVPTLGNEAAPEQILEFVERFRPLPVCTVSLTLPGHPNVQIDNEAGVASVVEHLVEVHRYRSFVFLARPPEHIEGRLRRRAYADALAKYGIEPLPDIVVPGDPAQDPALIRAALPKLGKVDAIVAVDDYLVPCLMQALGALGLRVPQDIAVTGFDDSDIARGGDPPLTSVRQPFHAMLDAALGSVLDRLNQREVPMLNLVPPELVLRRSCGCMSDDVSLYPPAVDSESSAAQLLAEAREGLLTEWRKVVGLRLEAGWEEPLYAAFVEELIGVKQETARRLSATLAQQSARGGELHDFGAVLAILKRTVLPLLGATPLILARAESLIQRLRSQLRGAEAGRAQGQRIRSEVLSREHAVVAERLLRNLDKGLLLDTLPECFLRVGVLTFWFSTYLDPAVPELVAKLACAMVHEAHVDPALHSERFRPTRLVPESQRPSSERYSWVVSPVHDEDHQFGLLVCDFVRDHGVTYDIMALQLGAALHGALLVQRIAQETERRERVERERLTRELELAQRIQTSILPRDLHATGLEIATVMLPATEVGGDYFDVIPLSDGCFFGIGDVAGHGLDTGLVMMMLQSAVASAVAVAPTLAPSKALQAVNRVLYENIRGRLLNDQHVTLTLLRYHAGGLVSFAGAHEDMLLFRAATNKTELVPVSGTWSGVLPDISGVTRDEQVTLEAGDVLVLYTDGATEAMNAAGQLFGLDRLAAVLAQCGREPVTQIRDELINAVRSWLHEQEDDIAFVVIRHSGES